MRTLGDFLPVSYIISQPIEKGEMYAGVTVTTRVAVIWALVHVSRGKSLLTFS